jgi:branched-chain amino acid transport system permease protein
MSERKKERLCNMNQILANGIVAGSAYALIAIGFSLIYSTVRFFHFAHGAVYTVAAYVGWVLHVSGLPFIFCIIISCLIASLLGSGIYLGVYAPLQMKRSPQLIFLLASFALFVFFSGLLQLIFGGDIQAYKGFVVKEGHNIAGALVTNHQLVIIATTLVVTFILSVWLSRTNLGRAIRAVADDPLAASLMGVNSRQVVSVVFAIGSGLAGLAGVLISFETNLYPAMGFDAILKGIVAALIGGLGNIYGALLGGLVLGLAENFGVMGISAGWKDTVAFLILVLFLLVRPRGMAGGEKSQREV